MYIEYMTPQRIADPNYTKYDSKGGDYRPTWLIRASDWQKVPGHEATNGYHTLSYCWEQSGETIPFPDGEHICVDDGHHRIVETTKERRRISNLFRHRKQVPVATSEVTYDKLLQQICQDFDIEYLWYDKICIDQSNKTEKLREIKQMHLIYSNACYTIALVPEIYIDDPKKFDSADWFTGFTEAKEEAMRKMTESLWWKRCWTLEEVMMSTRILIVGRNTHFWSLADIKQGDKHKETDLLANTMLGFKEREVKSSNLVLQFAHFRTSTKPHDQVFALANIFKNVIDIDIDYDSDLSTVMNQFYRRLAEKDLSLMCFGSNLFPTGTPQNATTMDRYDLPSWTGVAGLHSPLAITDITLDQNCDYTIDDNMRLHIECRSYAIRPTKYNDDVFDDEERGKKADKYYHKVITSMDDFDGHQREALDWSQLCIYKATNCFATHYHKPNDQAPFLSPILPLSLTEECDECVILGVVFDGVVEALTIDYAFAGYDRDYLAPVARKSPDGSSFKIIGVIILKNFRYDEPLCSPQEVMDKMFGNLEYETRSFCIE